MIMGRENIEKEKNTENPGKLSEPENVRKCQKMPCTLMPWLSHISTVISTVVDQYVVVLENAIQETPEATK